MGAQSASPNSSMYVIPVQLLFLILKLLGLLTQCRCGTSGCSLIALGWWMTSVIRTGWPWNRFLDLNVKADTFHNRTILLYEHV